MHPLPLVGQSTVVSNHSPSTAGLRKANSKFKPAIGHSAQLPSQAASSFRNNVTSAFGVTTSPSAKTVSSTSTSTKSVPSLRPMDVIDLSSEPSLLDVTDQLSRKRVSNSTDFVQGSSSKRLKSITSVEQDDALHPSDWKTNAGHVPPGQVRLPGRNIQNCIPLKTSSIVGTPSVSPPTDLCTTPLMQKLAKSTVQPSPHRQSYPDLQHSLYIDN
ncbi:hypothetical protein EDC04DRAFT_834540 [Pisolithus marmoratus]|nr:hypothetical protein EDC04DRAFT_834540 [Pisolithus marmoratus]